MHKRILRRNLVFGLSNDCLGPERSRNLVQIIYVDIHLYGEKNSDKIKKIPVVV